jgi:trk system potassium uptake protein TrkA
VKRANYIIIAGGGRVGYSLAKALELSGRDIVIIDKDPQVCEKLSSELKALIICGDASDKKTLEEAKIKFADVFVAATGNDNENIVACELAKRVYKVPLVMARVDDVDKAGMLEGLGIDLVVNPSLVTAIALADAIALPGTTSILISETITRAVEVHVPKGSSAIGKKIKDLPTGRRVGDLLAPVECVIAAIYRRGKLIIPRGNTVIRSGDILALIGKEEAIRKVAEILKE